VYHAEGIFVAYTVLGLTVWRDEINSKQNICLHAIFILSFTIEAGEEMYNLII
jgi:hypothetical protein